MIAVHIFLQFQGGRGQWTENIAETKSICIIFFALSLKTNSGGKIESWWLYTTTNVSTNNIIQYVYYVYHNCDVYLFLIFHCHNPVEPFLFSSKIIKFPTISSNLIITTSAIFLV